MKISVLEWITRLENRLISLEEIVDSDREDFVNFAYRNEPPPIDELVDKTYEEVDEVSSVLEEERESADEYITLLEVENNFLKQQVQWYKGLAEGRLKTKGL